MTRKNWFEIDKAKAEAFAAVKKAEGAKDIVVAPWQDVEYKHRGFGVRVLGYHIYWSE